MKNGQYFSLENAPISNGGKSLSGNWSFEVHGEHCRFQNLTTGQILEVFLGDKESVGDLDPYFFFEYLNSTEDYKHLAAYFERPFHDMLLFFDRLTTQKKMMLIHMVQFRIVK